MEQQVHGNVSVTSWGFMLLSQKGALWFQEPLRPTGDKFNSVHPHTNMRCKPTAHAHPYTHSPCSKTWLFYFIFLEEISVSLASSNFDLFIPKKSAMSIRPRCASPDTCPLSCSTSSLSFASPTFHFLPLSIPPFPPWLTFSLPIMPLLHTGLLSWVLSHETQKSWETGCCAPVFPNTFCPVFNTNKLDLHCSHNLRYAGVYFTQESVRNYANVWESAKCLDEAVHFWFMCFCRPLVYLGVFLHLATNFPNVSPWNTKPVMGIFAAIVNNIWYGSKLQIFPLSKDQVP